MKPDEFVPYLTKIQNKYAAKVKEIEVRKEALKQQYESNTNNSKKETKTKNIDTKLEAINKKEEQSAKYYYDEIVRAEQKFETYKKICLENIDKIRDKYNTERELLENKKESVDNDFDETNDKVLNKLKLELENYKNDKIDAEATMESLRIQEVNRQKQRLKDEQDEARLLEIARLRKERVEEEERATELFYQRCDESDRKEEEEYKKYHEEREKEKEERLQIVIQENIKLYNMKLELQKKWNKKQEKTYRKLSKDKRLDFLTKEIDEVLRLLTIMS
jgi:hypothetical protein